LISLGLLSPSQRGTPRSGRGSLTHRTFCAKPCAAEYQRWRWNAREAGCICLL